MSRTRFAVGVGALALVLAGCGTSGGSDTSSGAPGQKGFQPPDVPMQKSIGKGEGAVDILAWPGYAEDGSNDKTVDWVTPFEKQTGCQAKVKYFGTSDEAVSLMKTGDYDVVSASGDASLRLIAGGNVAPFNTKLTPSYADVAPFLKDRDWNSVDKQMYGIPHGWGANLLMYNTKTVKPAPTTWASVFDDASTYKGKVTAYDSPIYIADAALYLMQTKPELKIKDPYALDKKQLDAAVAVLKKQRAERRGVLVGLHQGGQRLQGRLDRHRHHLAGDREHRRRGRAGEGDPARQGLDRLVGHLDGRRQGEAPELRLQVGELRRLPEGQRAGRGVLR